MKDLFKNTKYRVPHWVGSLVVIAALLITGCDSEEPVAEEAFAAESLITVAAEEETAEYQAEPRIRGSIVPAEISDARTPSAELPPLQGREQANLTYAPEVPAPIDRDHATTVRVDMEMHEVVKEIADGVAYEFWTFGGETPGPMIRVREGDMVEFNLINDPANNTPHNIDLHSVTGPGGGAEATVVAPGQQATFSFRALNPGLYVYHCAMAPVDLHIANGMYGLILVEPEEGLPKVDREYYVLQSEFYTDGAHGETGLQAFNRQKALNETPDYVLFNGRVGALSGENALQAATGESVRLYVGNGGPNLSSSFHVIGAVLDKVYTEGGTEVNQRNVQTTMVPAGGAATVEFEATVPGTLKLVDHAIFRAINKGAVGELKVVGQDQPEIFTGQQKLEAYDPTADAQE